MNDTVSAALRTQIAGLLQGGHAHMTLNQAVEHFPPEFYNVCPPNVDYTPWHLLEHLRIAQWDILDYIRNPDYTLLTWPDEYWPSRSTQADSAAWRHTLDQFRADLNALIAIAQDPTIDLTGPLPHAPEHTYLRELLLVADHNAYHIGEFGILRQVMGTWRR